MATNYPTDNIWFPPINVIYHFNRLVQEGKLIPGTAQHKKAYEMFVVAISTVGIEKSIGKKFWIQLVDDKEQSPDIRTGCYHKKTRDNDFIIQDIEVVTYEDHTTSGLVEFLLKTKLAPTKSYDDTTTILCHIKKAAFLPALDELNTDLLKQKIKQNSPVMIVGKVSPTEEIYKIAQIYPTVNHVVIFNLLEEIKTQKRTVLVLKRSGKNEIESQYNPLEKHYPFERMNIK